MKAELRWIDIIAGLGNKFSVERRSTTLRTWGSPKQRNICFTLSSRLLSAWTSRPKLIGPLWPFSNVALDKCRCPVRRASNLPQALLISCILWCAANLIQSYRFIVERRNSTGACAHRGGLQLTTLIHFLCTRESSEANSAIHTVVGRRDMSPSCNLALGRPPDP